MEKDGKLQMNNRQAELDKIAEELQAEIDAKDAQDFSAHALFLARNPVNRGSLPISDPSVIYSKVSSDCGDTIIFYLQIQMDLIKKITFELEGCAVCSIAASQLILLSEGKTIQEAMRITAKDMIQALGKFPQENFHSIGLAIKGLHQAIEQYLHKAK